MSFLKDVARKVKLNAAAIPDLESEIFKNAESFERAVELLVDQFDDDLSKVISQTEVAAATILDFNKNDKIQKIKDANHFAGRIDRILAYRCKQYVEIADHYKITMLDAAARKNREAKALAYLKKMKNTLDLINRLATISLGTITKESDIKLHSYLTKLSVLTWEQVKEMLQKGEVPFRLK
jgi:hypothetical protein